MLLSLLLSEKQNVSAFGGFIPNQGHITIFRLFGQTKPQILKKMVLLDICLHHYPSAHHRRAPLNSEKYHRKKEKDCDTFVLYRAYICKSGIAPTPQSDFPFPQNSASTTDVPTDTHGAVKR